MFAHQVIEDFRLIPSFESRSEAHLKIALEEIDYIKQSIHFHFDIESGLGLFKKYMKPNASSFKDELGTVRLPFKCCWFSYTRTIDNDPRKEKRGWLLVEEDENEHKHNYGFSAILFCHAKHSNLGFFWDRRPWIYNITPGCDFEQRSKVKNRFGSINGRMVIQDGSICALEASLYKGETAEYVGKCLKEDVEDVALLNFMLLILSCKNIETEKNYPPEALNKKRLKHHKQPLFTYHTLVIKPIGKKQESIPRHLWENRIHLCRGHFKTYTEEKPLFGHITGRFWWQPSVRGRNRDGIVMKDYLIENGKP